MLNISFMKIKQTLLSVVLSLSLVFVPFSDLSATTEIEDFVNRAYQLILGRESDKEGLDYWVGGLISNDLDAAHLIYGIVNSQEFAMKNLENSEQVEVLYNAMLNRDSDAEGKASWTDILDNGCSVNAVLQGFAGSQEFRNLCDNYGIIPGTIELTEGRDKNFNITAFVTRAYNVLLGRAPDIDGLNGWCDQILDGSIVAASLVDSFVRSNEYGNFSKSSNDFVNDLYQVMLGRGADEPGLAHWVEVYDNGVSETYMIEQFTGSDEYKNLCSSYGIASGHLKLTQNRDQDLDFTEFINDCYFYAFGRKGDREGLNAWTGKLIYKNEHVIDIVKDFLFADECTSKNYSDEEFVRIVYRIAFGRAPSDSELSEGVGRLGSDSRRSFVNDMLNTDEFASYLEKFDLVPKFIPDKMICLTFDDGPYSPVTNRILDALEAVDGHATFFIVGNRAETYSSCIAREKALGCEIANHTWSHPNSGLTSISSSAVAQEIASCNNQLESMTGMRPSVMRPVGGSYNDSVASSVGMPMIIWSLDTADWKYRDTDHVINAILDNVSDGDVILMHDLYPTTAAAVEIVIPELVRRGYALVTVSELAEYRDIDLEAGVAYYSLR